MSIGYWNYYQDDFSWDDSHELLRPDLTQSRSKLIEAGLSVDEAHRYVSSGFVYQERSDTFIDRYYGGALLSTDMRTRFPFSHLPFRDPRPQSRVRVCRARSWRDVRRAIEEFAVHSRGRLLFRGQTENYKVCREVSNPHFLIDGLGEISLIPSLWRRMLRRRMDSFVSFQNLKLAEWSLILYSAFDLKDIEYRQKALYERGEFVLTMSDMEDCSDPVLQEYGSYRLDLAMGLDFNLANLLATLLQHYGLDTCVLDMTSSLDVAIFFATHRLTRVENVCTYEHVGTNSRKAVLYVLRENHREMQAYEQDERVIKKLPPLRPMRQDCVISKSAPYALNLPADFLIGVIFLDFDSPSNESKLAPRYLFPCDDEDSFLKALKTSSYAREHLTDFT